MMVNQSLRRAASDSGDASPTTGPALWTPIDPFRSYGPWLKAEQWCSHQQSGIPEDPRRLPGMRCTDHGFQGRSSGGLRKYCRYSLSGKKRRLSGGRIITLYFFRSSRRRPPARERIQALLKKRRDPLFRGGNRVKAGSGAFDPYP